jgi:hypothetical protein
MKSPSGSVLRGMCLGLVGLVAWCAIAQEPPPAATPPASGSSSSKGKKYSHASDFLIIGTVFNDKGYAFSGVELRIRRSNEKKFRWDSYTNSRGDFAVRVPQGTDYELVVHAKGFADQTRSMDAKSGVSEARLVFRLEPAKDGK